MPYEAKADECSTQTTPTDGPAPTLGPTTPSGLKAFLSKNTPESSKRLIAFLSACVLGFCTVALTEAIIYQAHRHWSIDGALITAFTFIAAFVAGLATAIYHKSETGGDA